MQRDGATSTDTNCNDTEEKVTTVKFGVTCCTSSEVDIRNNNGVEALQGHKPEITEDGEACQQDEIVHLSVSVETEKGERQVRSCSYSPGGASVTLISPYKLCPCVHVSADSSITFVNAFFFSHQWQMLSLSTKMAGYNNLVSRVCFLLECVALELTSPCYKITEII